MNASLCRHSSRVSMAFALVATLGGAAVATASTPDGASWLSTWGDGPPVTGLVPSAWVDRDGLGFTVRGVMAIPVGRGGMPVAESPVLVELGAAAAGRAFQPNDEGSLSMRVHAMGPSMGFWLGGSVLKQDIMAEDAFPVLGVGSWASRGRFVFGVQTLQFLNRVKTRSAVVLNVVRVDSTTTNGAPNVRSPELQQTDARMFTGAEASAGFTTGRLQIDSRFGTLLSHKRQPGQWVELRAAYRPVTNLAVFARTRAASGVPDGLETVRGNQSALGVEFSPGPPPRHEAKPVAPAPALDMRSLGSGRYALVFVTRGRRLEVCGDATGWAPVAAAHRADGAWEVELDLTPGVQRVAFRVDGGKWQPPPGLPTAEGEFGDVGLIVIE